MTSVTEKVKLSQWEALLLEALRHLGWSDQQLLELGSAQQLPVDESEYEFDYAELAAFAIAQPDVYRAAVQDGYRIKYNTIRGIRSWLHIAFELEPELILEEGQEAVIATLTKAQYDRLCKVLSPGWVIRDNVAEATYRIEPLYIAH